MEFQIPKSTGKILKQINSIQLDEFYLTFIGISTILKIISSQEYKKHKCRSNSVIARNKLYSKKAELLHKLLFFCQK